MTHYRFTHDNCTEEHFERRCMSCDARRAAFMSLGQMEERYRTGRVCIELSTAYKYLWVRSAFHYGHHTYTPPTTEMELRFADMICAANPRAFPAHHQ